MAVKSDAQVVIGGKIYTLSGYENPEYLQKVASYINRKIEEVSSVGGFSSLSPDIRAALININIADDYFKAKSAADEMHEEVNNKEKEIYELKHDLVSARMKIGELEKTIKDDENKIKELQIVKEKLKAFNFSF